MQITKKTFNTLTAVLVLLPFFLHSCTEPAKAPSATTSPKIIALSLSGVCLYSMNSDGFSRTKLPVNVPGNSVLPLMLHKSKKLAFLANNILSVTNFDGTGKSSFVIPTGDFSDVIWSDDGDSLMLIDDGARNEIYTISREGTGLKKLTETNEYNEANAK